MIFILGQEGLIVFSGLSDHLCIHVRLVIEAFFAIDL